MAPAGFELMSTGLGNIDVPMMTLGGQNDELTSMQAQVNPIFNGLTAEPRWLGELLGAGHYTFSNACDLVNVFDDCNPPYLDPQQAHPLINQVTVAFLQSIRGYSEGQAYLPGDDALWNWTAVEGSQE